MCQAHVYLVRDGQEEEVVRDVILLERTEEGVRLYTFFEEPQTIAAEVAQVDLLKHTVRLVPKEVES
jgi:predicted RNA-binding protein